MKTFLLLTSFLLGVTAVSPAAVKQRQSDAATQQAHVSNFSASTTENDNGASITYDLEIPDVINAMTHCTYTDTTTADTKLPAVDLTQGTCDDPAVNWQFRQDPSGPGSEGGRFRLVVVVNGGRDGAGFYEWAPVDFPLVGEETVYQGTPDFDFDFGL